MSYKCDILSLGYPVSNCKHLTKNIDELEKSPCSLIYMFVIHYVYNGLLLQYGTLYLLRGSSHFLHLILTQHQLYSVLDNLEYCQGATVM